MKNIFKYKIQHASGLAIGCGRYGDAEWSTVDYAGSAEEARKALALSVGLAADRDVAGYEEDWRAFVAIAKKAKVGQVVSFDIREHAWRFVRGED